MGAATVGTGTAAITVPEAAGTVAGAATVGVGMGTMAGASSASDAVVTESVTAMTEAVKRRFIARILPASRSP